MPFLDHLEELRWRILWALLALAVTTGLAFALVWNLPIIDLLKRPIDPYLEDGKLIYLAVTDAFFIMIKVALALGFVLASPIVFYQIWAFLAPALTAKERKAIVPALYLGLILFFGGVALAYFVALPFTLQFLFAIEVENLVPAITAGAYFGFVLKLLVGFGVLFEMPVVVLVLSALGLITSKFLRSKRRYAIAGLAVLAAVITPGDAITATVVLMGPLVLLYELGIGLARLVERGRAQEAAAEAVPGAT
ncbi:MAG: twin-arginine translocase subunit TatC [Gemmatimonadetes bacterium]|nr:twin-arginine translocase subunit TatC [Gemmatimonadota bacterium]